jgi:gas vesicle protein
MVIEAARYEQLRAKEEDMRWLTRFLVGAIIGGVIGSALALLLTPSSGVALRQQIHDSMLDIQNEVRQAALQRRVELEHQLAELRAQKEIQAE